MGVGQRSSNQTPSISCRRRRCQSMEFVDEPPRPPHLPAACRLLANAALHCEASLQLTWTNHIREVSQHELSNAIRIIVQFRLLPAITAELIRFSRYTGSCDTQTRGPKE